MIETPGAPAEPVEETDAGGIDYDHDPEGPDTTAALQAEKDAVEASEKFELKGDLNVLEAHGAQALAMQILNVGQVAQQFGPIEFDAVLVVLEKNLASAKLQGAPAEALIGIEAQIEVVKAVRHLNRHLHKVNTSLQARAKLTMPGAMPVGPPV